MWGRAAQGPDRSDGAEHQGVDCLARTRLDGLLENLARFRELGVLDGKFGRSREDGERMVRQTFDPRSLVPDQPGPEELEAAPEGAEPLTFPNLDERIKIARERLESAQEEAKNFYNWKLNPGHVTILLVAGWCAVATLASALALLLSRIDSVLPPSSAGFPDILGLLVSALRDVHDDLARQFAGTIVVWPVIAIVFLLAAVITYIRVGRLPVPFGGIGDILTFPGRAAVQSVPAKGTGSTQVQADTREGQRAGAIWTGACVVLALLGISMLLSLSPGNHSLAPVVLGYGIAFVCLGLSSMILVDFELKDRTAALQGSLAWRRRIAVAVFAVIVFALLAASVARSVADPATAPSIITLFFISIVLIPLTALVPFAHMLNTTFESVRHWTMVLAMLNGVREKSCDAALVIRDRERVTRREMARLRTEIEAARGVALAYFNEGYEIGKIHRDSVQVEG